MRTAEVLHVSDAFDKEAERTRHLFKGQQPIEVRSVYPGGVVYVTTGVPDRQYWPPVMCSTGDVRYLK